MTKVPHERATPDNVQDSIPAESACSETFPKWYGEHLAGLAFPDHFISVEMQASLEQWRITGVCPIPELSAITPEYLKKISPTDQNLLRDMAVWSADLQNRGCAQHTPWAPKMLFVIAVGVQTDFVMSAVLAFSACHLAWYTKDPRFKTLSYRHEREALRGLREVVDPFSKETSEAILAASMILLWQAPERLSWQFLQNGVAKVMHQMKLGLYESQLALYIKEETSIADAHMPVVLNCPEDPPALLFRNLESLQQTAHGLQRLQLCPDNHQELLDIVEQLITHIQQISSIFPTQSADDVFSHIQALRSWLFWLPPQLLRPERSELGALVVMSHLYVAALTFEWIFPKIRGACWGSMSIWSVRTIHHIFMTRMLRQVQEPRLQSAFRLIQGSIEIVGLYCSQG